LVLKDAFLLAGTVTGPTKKEEKFVGRVTVPAVKLLV